MAGIQQKAIEDQVAVECPTCHLHIPVAIIVTLYNDRKGQHIYTEPDLTDVHLHALVCEQSA